MASFYRDRDFGRDWSPSPIRPKCWVTYTPGEVPSSGEPLESYARWDEAYKCLPPTCPVRRVPPDNTDWSTPAEGSEASLSKELECPPPLEPFVQELLKDEKASCTDAGMDSGLPPPSPLTSGDPEPSPIEYEHWIKWHTRYVDTPAWWCELEAVPNVTDP